MACALDRDGSLSLPSIFRKTVVLQFVYSADEFESYHWPICRLEYDLLASIVMCSPRVVAMVYIIISIYAQLNGLSVTMDTVYPIQYVI